VEAEKIPEYESRLELARTELKQAFVANANERFAANDD
jgi:hypothetical protein